MESQDEAGGSVSLAENQVPLPFSFLTQISTETLDIDLCVPGNISAILLANLFLGFCFSSVEIWQKSRGSYFSFIWVCLSKARITGGFQSLMNSVLKE